MYSAHDEISECFLRLPHPQRGVGVGAFQVAIENNDIPPLFGEEYPKGGGKQGPARSTLAASKGPDKLVVILERGFQIVPPAQKPL
jgi:hypothetical protein